LALTSLDIKFQMEKGAPNESLQRLPAVRQGWLTATSDFMRWVRKMKKGSRIISRGPFKGKRIEFAPTTGINKLLKISEDFMIKIFGLEPGEYLISDESSLYDFTGLDGMELPDIHKKIQEMYNIDVSDIKSRNLLEIFRRISDSKSRASC